MCWFGTLGLAMIVSAAPVTTDLDRSSTPREVRAKLTKRFNFTGVQADTPLKEGLDILANTFEVTILIDKEGYRNIRTQDPETLPLNLAKMDQVPFRTVLRAMLEQTSSDYLIDSDGTIRIVPEAVYTERLLKQSLTESFERRPLNQVLRDLADRFSVSIVVDERRAGEKVKAPVSADFKDVSLGTVLTQLADMAELRAVGMGRTIYVTTPENAKSVTAAPLDPAQAAAVAPSRKARERLESRVTVDGFEPNTPLKEAIGFLSERYGIEIHMELDALKQERQIEDPESHPVKLRKLVNVPLHTVLQTLLKQVSAQFVVDPDGIVWVIPASENATDRILKYRLCEAVHRKPLTEVLHDLSDRYGVSIVLDERRAGDRARAVVTADMEDVTLQEAVRILAELAELKAVAVGRSLMVTTAENARTIAAEERSPSAPPATMEKVTD
jgi:hypothetical protein